jgi:uncharacterized protein (UPF0212 family)
LNSSEYAKPQGFHGSLGIAGFRSTASTLAACPGTGAGGSCFPGSTTPSWIGMTAKAGWKFPSGVDATIGLQPSLIGTLAPKGILFTGVVTIPLSGDAQSSAVEQAESRRDVEIEKPIERRIQRPDSGWVTYDLQAQVTRVNDKLQYVRLDKGTSESVKVGDVFDVFSVKSDGTILEAIARVKVESVKENESAAKVKEYFKEVWIEEGFVAKRPLSQP